MLVKSAADELQNYLTDASNLQGGHAQKLFIPETTAEVAEIIREANQTKTPVTASGARTGIVGGAVPFGGCILSLEKFNRIKSIEKTDGGGGKAFVEAGVALHDFQKEVESKGLFYPPDPTEWSCQIGGTIATNASGSRSFKYGSTRGFVEGLTVVLPTGDVVNIERGAAFAANGETIELKTIDGKTIRARLPTYAQPPVRKNTSGYFTAQKLDAIDLFVGSEGTLGIVTEAHLKLLAQPAGFLSGIVFFKAENDLLNFVKEARELSFETRKNSTRHSALSTQHSLDATLLEYFDDEALRFIREKFSEVPDAMAGAIFFEQETTEENEDELFERWNELLEKHHAEIDASWFTTGAADREKMREFRHALPVSVNEWIVRHKQRKVSTDIAVPDENFASMLRFYKQSLKNSGLQYVIFGHIGDCHLHVNILPRDAAEATRAKHLYGRFIAQGIMLGGTVSAEHGIGKIKSKYLYVQYGERYLNEMAELKRAFDPQGILGRDNMFDAKFLG
ncbi:MAG TPA: FAD-binding oxidoreductase [Pyrinomonadaceae bacterium]|nr:FAD-binding oxidoreductase [Pyrinomonadaceae bacterium]